MNVKNPKSGGNPHSQTPGKLDFSCFFQGSPGSPEDVSAMLFKIHDANLAQEPLNAAEKAAFIDKITTDMNSSDEILQLFGTLACSKLLDRVEDPSIKLMIPEGIIQQCWEFLSIQHTSVLKFQALTILAKLTSGPSDQTMVVVKNGPIANLEKLVHSPVTRVAEQAVRVLDNIAINGFETCDQVLKETCLPRLLRGIKPDTPLSLIKNMIRTSANICEMGKVSHSMDTVKEVIPILSKILQTMITGDTQIITDTIRCIRFLIDDSTRIQVLLEARAVFYIVLLLGFSDIVIVRHALTIVVFMTTGNNKQTDYIMNEGVLAKLRALLKHEEPDIVVNAILALSYLIAGPSEYIERFINAKIIPSLLETLDKVI